MSISPYLQPTANTITQPKVALFVTCLADSMRPSVAFATIKLLEAAGCEVHVPKAQTCCGQPAFNSGDRNNTRLIAQQTMAALAGYDYVVGPSGSCIGMLHQYPDLFEEGSKDYLSTQALARQAYEITSFLVDVMAFKLPPNNTKAQITYHDSCAGLRELGIHQQPRKLLAQMPNIQLKEIPEADTCCGFGGTFSVKHGDISAAMVNDKSKSLLEADVVRYVSADWGCMMNINGALEYQKKSLRGEHIASYLLKRTKGEK